MKYTTLLGFWIAASLFSIRSLGQSPKNGCLYIEVHGIENRKGIVRMMLYDDASKFLVNHGSCRAVTVPADENINGSVFFEMDDLPFGNYAAAIYHDENSNGRLDINILDVPVEPYCFYHEVRAKWKMPVFSKVKFEVNQSCIEMSATLRRWSAQ